MGVGEATGSPTVARRDFAFGQPVASGGNDQPAIGPIATAIGVGYTFLAPIMFLGAYPIKPTALFLLSVIAILGIVLLPREVLRTMRISLPLVGYVAWSIASYMWSESPDSTKLYLRTVTISVIAISIVAAYLPRALFVKSLLRSMEFIVVLTVLAVVSSSSARSHIGVDGGISEAGGWRGFFDHKNFMSPVIVLAILAIIAFETNRRLATALVMGSVGLLAGAQSATGLAAMGLAFVFWYWTGVISQGGSRERTVARVGTSLVLLTVVGFVLTYVAQILEAFGKDLTFTGRTDIWALTWPLIGDRPIQGYGLSGPFIDLRSPVALDTFKSLGFYVQHAHNGVIDLLATLGIVGLGLVGALIVGCFRSAWKAVDRNPRMARWVISSMMVLLVISFSEAAFAGRYIALVGAIRILLLMESGDADEVSSYAAVANPRARDV